VRPQPVAALAAEHVHPESKLAVPLLKAGPPRTLKLIRIQILDDLDEQVVPSTRSCRFEVGLSPFAEVDHGKVVAEQPVFALEGRVAGGAEQFVHLPGLGVRLDGGLPADRAHLSNVRLGPATAPQTPDAAAKPDRHPESQRIGGFRKEYVLQVDQSLAPRAGVLPIGCPRPGVYRGLTAAAGAGDQHDVEWETGPGVAAQHTPSGAFESLSQRDVTQEQRDREAKLTKG
jgi:hypothetical protein